MLHRESTFATSDHNKLFLGRKFSSAIGSQPLLLSDHTKLLLGRKCYFIL